MSTITKTWTDGAFTVTWRADEDGCGYGKLTASEQTKELLYEYCSYNPEDIRYGFSDDMFEELDSTMEKYPYDVPLWGPAPNACFVDEEGQHYLVQFTDYAVRFEVEDVIREGCTPIYVSTYTPVDDDEDNEYDV